jgi:hypothetical protein
VSPVGGDLLRGRNEAPAPEVHRVPDATPALDLGPAAVGHPVPGHDLFLRRGLPRDQDPVLQNGVEVLWPVVVRGWGLRRQARTEAPAAGC